MNIETALNKTMEFGTEYVGAILAFFVIAHIDTPSPLDIAFRVSLLGVFVDDSQKAVTQMTNFTGDLAQFIGVVILWSSIALFVTTIKCFKSSDCKKKILGYFELLVRASKWGKK